MTLYDLIIDFLKIVLLCALVLILGGIYNILRDFDEATVPASTPMEKLL